MKLIAHRGLYSGPNSALENTPTQIESALSLGFDVEVDVHFVNDTWLLGHDDGIHPVSRSFLERPGIWCHCKNFKALVNATPAMHYFWHQDDDFVLTSRGFVWSYPGKCIPSGKAVRVMPESHYDLGDILLGDPTAIFRHNFYAVCSDYVKPIKDSMFPKITLQPFMQQ